MIGKSLSHFKITSKLGEGGMGEVYEAWDQSLERSVALKILPPEVVRNPDRVRRFVQEAKSASALSHPHIITIYEIGEATPTEGDQEPAREGEPLRPQAPTPLGPSVHFIAMERIDGSTLKSKIHVEKAPSKDLLRWLGQAAEGLAKAHSEGIVHRDLKPDNIMVTTDGYAKVLDFGLAKLTESVTEAGGTQVPTMAGEETAEGAVMGTVGYMSPEQVQGKRVDHRTDIFSFGCLLYEAMTGQRPFEGETAVDTMHQILRAQPASVRELSPETPAAVRRVIRRCLAKDPDRRYQSMKDLGLGLADLVEEWDELASRTDSVTTSGSVAPISAPPGQRRWLGFVVATACGALALVAGMWFIRSSNPPPPKISPPIASFSRITQQPGVEYEPALSPDGRYLAYVSDAEGEEDIYLLRVGGRNPVNLTADSGVGNRAPAFSPDGEQIAFSSRRDGGGIFVMGATGESVRRLTDFGFNPTWSPDGSKIAIATEAHSDPYGRTAQSALWVVDVGSGETRKITDGDAMQPTWSPNGQRIAFWGLRDFAAGGAQREIGTVSAEGGEPVWVTEDPAVDWSPAWAPDSETLFYVSDRGGSPNIWQVGIDPGSGEAVSEPRPQTAPSRLVGRITLSADGTQLVYEDVNVTSNVAYVELKGGEAPGDPVKVTRGSNEFVQAKTSPDGQWVVFRTAGAQEDLFVARTDGSDLLQLTDDPAKDRQPGWSADNQRILFYSDRSGRYEFWVIHRDGSGLEQLTQTEGDSYFYPKWSTDDSKIVATQGAASAIWDMTKAPPSRELTLLPPIDEGRFLFDPEWSPDGSRLAGVILEVNQTPSRNEGVAIYALQAGQYETVYVPEADQIVLGTCWMSDGSGLLLEMRRSDDSHFLASLDLASGELEELWTAPEGALDLRPSSDGRVVTFIQDVEESDLWLADFE